MDGLLVVGLLAGGSIALAGAFVFARSVIGGNPPAPKIKAQSGEQILRAQWQRYLAELGKAERRAKRVLPKALKEEAHALDVMMATVQTEVRSLGGIRATPVQVAAAFKAQVDGLFDPNSSESRGVAAVARPLGEAGFQVDRIEPALAALRAALSGWTDERFAPLFEVFLNEAFPSREVLRGLQAALELPELGEEFRIAKGIVDALLAYRRSRGHRDGVSEDVLVATVVDYAAAAWLRRRLEAVIAFFAREQDRRREALNEDFGDRSGDSTLFETSVEDFAEAPLVRWQSPRVVIDRVEAEFVYSLYILCSNDGGIDSVAQVQRCEARLHGWGIMHFDEFGPGSRICSARSSVQKRFTLRIRSDPMESFQSGYQRISWSVVYTDQKMRAYLTTGHVEISVEEVGQARILREALDEGGAEQRYRRYLSGAPLRPTS